MNVILIGYRASGKSTVGLLLSKRLQVSFVDTDQLIEEAAGLSINELVALEGWERFREKETEAIASLRDVNACVVATGGGVILSYANRDLLKNRGTLIYLKTPLPDIIERLKRDTRDDQSRPQLTSENLVAETIAMLNERIPLYESAADFTVDTQDKSVVRVTDDIYQYLLEAGIVFEINKLKKMLKNNS
jgi:shikimate kinase